MMSTVPDNNATLAEHAAAIHTLRSHIVSDVAEIGGRLTEAKRIVGHGNWLPWLDREFGWTDDTARNFMRLHEFVEGLSNSETVRDLVLTLPVSSVYLLAAPSTPKEAVDEIIERVEAGEPVSVAKVKRVVDTAKGKQPAKKSNRPKASDPPSSSAKTLQKRNAARRLKIAANGKKTLYCLFCDKSQHEVECLITHREDSWVAICDECVAACVKTIAEQKTKQNTPPPPPADDGLGIPDFLDRSKQMEIAPYLVLLAFEHYGGRS
jgi:hypothetical protein